MKWFRKVKTIYKALASFLVLALLITALGVQSVVTLKSILNGTDELYNKNTQAISRLAEVVQHYQKTRVTASNMMSLKDLSHKQSEFESLQKKYVLIQDTLDAVRPLLKEEHVALLDTIKEEIDVMSNYNKLAVEASLNGRDGQAAIISKQADATAGSVQDSISELEQLVIEQAGNTYNEIAASGANSITLLIGALLVCDVLAVLLGILLTRMVVKPLMATANQIERLAEGEQAEAIDPSKMSGEFRTMGEGIVRLRETVAHMNQSILLLADAGTHGRLSMRADTGNMKGYYLEMVEGINRTLDAVIEPVNEAAAVLGELSRGNLDARVEGEYEGDHAIIKDALNSTIDSLRAQIGEVSTVLEKVAESDLTESVTGEFAGDFSALKESVNKIVESLNTVLYDINIASEQVASGTRQVSDGSQAISQGATEQASSIEELTASIASIAEQTRQNAVNANDSREISVAAREGAAAGDAKMRELQKAMEEINESSASISKVIKVIDDIAFQTNILALNAAVEAARAGVHGKGFAVVAEEVRNLAAKSAQAAKETAALIEGSLRKTEAGTRIADETAEALSSIVEGMDKGVLLTSGIAAASSEQATAIAQVNKGIEQMSAVVQTNSATAEEAAAASEELSGQADLLKGMIGKFKLRKAAQPAPKKAADGARKAQEAPSGHGKIILNDGDFGKY